MKRFFFFPLLLAILAFSLTSCDMIMDIFNTGVWVGVMLVLLVVFLIFYFLNKGRDNTKT